ncbi:hypothetical protein ACLOJK_029631 [Asimina triloba]
MDPHLRKKEGERISLAATAMMGFPSGNGLSELLMMMGFAWRRKEATMMGFARSELRKNDDDSDSLRGSDGILVGTTRSIGWTVVDERDHGSSSGDFIGLVADAWEVHVETVYQLEKSVGTGGVTIRHGFAGHRHPGRRCGHSDREYGGELMGPHPLSARFRRRMLTMLTVKKTAFGVYNCHQYVPVGR